MLICEIRGVFGLVGKSCPIENFGNDYQERTFRRAKRDDLPGYRCSATAAPSPQAGARHRGPELAPDHENLRNPGYWAADKPAGPEPIRWVYASACTTRSPISVVLRYSPPPQISRVRPPAARTLFTAASMA